ncbi:MAG: N-acyl homoserine lactonase family protein [Chloroflexota bacterium]
MRLYYYMWVLQGEDGQAVLVDTGILEEDGRNKNLLNRTDPRHLLAHVNVDPGEVWHVILTHLHWDHCSALRLYPKATFHVQRKELEFWTGPLLRFRQIKESAGRVAELVGLADQGRVDCLDGDAEIVPGVNVMLLGGHTPGSQAVVVQTQRGRVVLCGDAADFYLNLDHDVMGAALDLPTALLAFDRMRGSASFPELLVPGHEPAIMKRFPIAAPGVVEVA